MSEPVGLLEAMDQVAAMMADAGVKAVVGPADLAIPGGILYPNTVTFDTLAGPGYDLTLDLVLVAGAGGDRNAIPQLDAMLSAVRDLLGIIDARAVSLTLPSHSPDPLPALQATVTVHVT